MRPTASSFKETPSSWLSKAGDRFAAAWTARSRSTTPLLEELRSDRLTGYLALAMRFSDGNRNPISFQIDAPDGFATHDVEALERITNAMALFVESETRYRTARQLLETYVG